MKVDFLMMIDDEREGLPFIDASPDWILNGFKSVKGLTQILPGARFDISLSREHINALHKRDRPERRKRAKQGARP